MFVKNTGTVWVGFNSDISINNEIGPDITNGTLYLKGGIAFKDITLNPNDTASTSNTIRIFNSENKLNTRIGSNNLPLFKFFSVGTNTAFDSNGEFEFTINLTSSNNQMYNWFVSSYNFSQKFCVFYKQEFNITTNTFTFGVKRVGGSGNTDIDLIFMGILKVLI